MICGNIPSEPVVGVTIFPFCIHQYNITPPQIADQLSNEYILGLHQNITCSIITHSMSIDGLFILIRRIGEMALQKLFGGG